MTTSAETKQQKYNRGGDGRLRTFAQLEVLKKPVTEEPLHKSGRHFVDGSYSDLTSCHHGDTGEYHNSEDGVAIAILWILWKAGALNGQPGYHMHLLSQGAKDVVAERLRQIDVEGFRVNEDDQYTAGEMAWAAVCYLQNAAVAGKMQGLGLVTAEDCVKRAKSLPTPEVWPWAAEWWKPSGQRQDLVKAAALIVAEIERLDRAAGRDESISKC